VERRGVQGGDPPAKAKRRLLKYLRKGNYYFVATNWGGTKQKQITKNNRFEKQQISKISHLENNTFQKKQQMKKNSKFQKTTDLKKEQISKNNKFQKIGMIKSYFLEFGVFIVICSLF
jgi:hypothetical protein